MYVLIGRVGSLLGPPIKIGIVTGHIVYVHVIAIVYRQGTVYGSTGPCGELRGNVVR